MERVVALTFALLSAAGCATPGAAPSSTPTTLEPTVASSTLPAAPAPERWACPPGSRSDFFTDPVVYPVDVPLRDIVADIDADSFRIDRTGYDATVTFRDGRGRITMRYEYVRGDTRGWSLERGRDC